MQTVLIATDADEVFDEVEAALGSESTRIYRVRRGRDVRPAVDQIRPDLVILDLQIGNMGGMAACLDLRLEEGGGRLPRSVVLMLLDRSADVFLAKRASADGWLVKPLDAFRLRRATETLRSGGNWFDGAPEGASSLVGGA